MGMRMGRRQGLRSTHLARGVTSRKNCTRANRLWWWSETQLRAQHSGWSCGTEAPGLLEEAGFTSALLPGGLRGAKGIMRAGDP